MTKDKTAKSNAQWVIIASVFLVIFLNAIILSIECYRAFKAKSQDLNDKTILTTKKQDTMTKKLSLEKDPYDPKNDMKKNKRYRNVKVDDSVVTQKLD